MISPQTERIVHIVAHSFRRCIISARLNDYRVGGWMLEIAYILICQRVSRAEKIHQSTAMTWICSSIIPRLVSQPDKAPQMIWITTLPDTLTFLFWLSEVGNFSTFTLCPV